MEVWLQVEMDVTPGCQKMTKILPFKVALATRGVEDG